MQRRARRELPPSERIGSTAWRVRRGSDGRSGEECSANPLPTTPPNTAGLLPDEIEIVEPVAALRIAHPEHRRIAVPGGGLLHHADVAAPLVLYHDELSVLPRHGRAADVAAHGRGRI